MEFEKQRYTELNKQLDDLKQQLKECKNSQMNPSDTSVHNLKTAKNIRTWDDRLKQINIKLNTVLDTNKKLKEEINELRRAKTRRNRVINRLEKKLKDKQQKHDDIQNELDETKEYTNEYYLFLLLEYALNVLKLMILLIMKLMNLIKNGVKKLKYKFILFRNLIDKKNY